VLFVLLANRVLVSVEILLNLLQLTFMILNPTGLSLMDSCSGVHPK
jgi:hypothetical protein